MTDEIVVLELRDTSPESAGGATRSPWTVGAYRIHVVAGVAPVTACASANHRPMVFAQALIRAVWSSRKRSSALSGLRASAHPPGFQSTSPSGFATRDRMNSKSDSRFRYFAGSTLTESPCWSIARHADRSARRATVRATCSSADSGVPPGSTNEFSAGSDSLNSSHHDLQPVDVVLADCAAAGAPGSRPPVSTGRPPRRTGRSESGAAP